MSTEAPIVRPEATVTPPPPVAESPPPPPPGKPAPSSAQLVAESRKRIQAHLTNLETERALSVLIGALAYAPRDKNLRAIGSKVVEQAQDRAVREHSRALAQGASGVGKFKLAERTAERARLSLREGNAAASARAYLDAAALFASCVTPATSVAHAAPLPRPVEPPVNAAEKASTVSSPASGPSATPAGSEPPRLGRPARRVAVDPVIEAYAAALTKGDRAALLEVYPTAPADVLGALGKKGPGIDSYNMRIEITRVVTYDDNTRAHVSVTVVHEFITRSGPRDKAENQMFELERKGESWVLVKVLPR